MYQKLSSSRSQKGVVSIVAAVVGLGLLVALVFSLNALFSSRTQQFPQTARQLEIEKQPDKVFVEEPSPTPTVATGRPDPTARWKMATNAEHGFSIKYPPQFFLFPEGENGTWRSITSYDPSIPRENLHASLDEGEFALQILLSGPLKPNETLLEYIMRQNPKKEPLSDHGPFSEYKVGEKRGYISESTGTIYFQHQGDVFYINTYTSPKELVNQILSTLRFVPE